nr:M56 family metallopeptidase [uncultured Agathobaculum sp.]
MLRFEWSGLLNNLVQIGLTVSAAALVLFLLRKVMKKRYPARAICFVWAILAIRLLIPVQLTLPDPPVQVTPIKYVAFREDLGSISYENGTPLQPVERTGPVQFQTFTESESWDGSLSSDKLIPVAKMLFILWGMGMLAYAIWQAYSYMSFLYLAREAGQPAERDTLHRVLAEQKQSLGIRRNIPLVVTPAADCPMLAGFVRPALYLPDEALSEQEAMFIFRHELTHYKRGDLWLKLLLTAAKMVHWFNPLVYLMARFAQEDIELACDDAVVRGMDGAARRAYGETILRSAAAQVKKRALVSCFTGDKKTLMRRFEGLFDTRAKKRGVALVVAAAVLVGSLGCAVSVGESKDSGDTFETQALAAAEEYGRALLANDGRRAAEVFTDRLVEESGLGDETQAENRLDTEDFDPWAINSGYWPIVRYTVDYEPDTQTCLMVREKDTSSQSFAAEGIPNGVPLRQAVRLSFEEVDGKVLIDSMEILHSEIDPVDSLETFRMLYENDLGLPDFLSAEIDWTAEAAELTDPGMAAVNLLHLAELQSYMISPLDPTEGSLGNDIWVGTFALADHSEIQITMINQFDQGWLPQDFTYEDGINNRTAADLAQQFARGVLHKSGQFIYPILSAEKQQDFIAQQRGQSGDGNWYWRYGGSSPAYRDFVVIPAEDGNACWVVFQMYGGGVTDYRSGFLVETGSEDGRTVITELTNAASMDLTHSELFRLYYDSGLAWPALPEGAERFNDQPLGTLDTPDYAAAVVFSYIGGTSAFELLSESGSEATVRIQFVDGSPSVDVRMQKTGDCWLPVGLAEQFDDSFRATAGEVALPVGASVEQAVQNAAGDVPLLAKGDEIELLFDPAPVGEVTIADSVIREDGTLQYSERETETSTFSYTGSVASMSYSYPVEHIPAELLSSTLTPYTYRGVTVSYTSADGVAHTASFVFRMEGVANQPDYTITSTTYHNDAYGYTLTLPDCFVGQGYMKEENGVVTFGMKNAWPDEVADPYGAGAVMSLAVGSVAELRDVFGEEWAENYFVPCEELAVQNGLAYMLLFASDVQYDPQDEAIVAAYTEMYQAAQAMGPESISFEGRTDGQRERERETVLRELATYYINREDYIGSVDVNPDAAENACTVVWTADPGSPSGAQGRPRRAARIWFEDLENIQPARTELLADSGDGVDSLETFLLLYDNGLALPELAEFEVRSLLEDTSITALRDPVQAAEWTLGLSGGTAGDRHVHPVWQGESWIYTWADGSRVRIGMKAVQLGGAAQPIYLPIWWDADTAGGSGWVFDPYTYMMRKESNDFSDCTAEELAYYLTLSDGAYTENILHELDLRWRDDPAGTDDAVAAYAQAENGLASLWENHKAANPDIFS